MAVQCIAEYTVAFVDQENLQDIYILHRNSFGTHSIEDLSDISTGGGKKIVRMAFGKEPGVLYVAHEDGFIAEVHIDERSINQLSVQATIDRPSIFSDHHGSLYVYSTKEMQKLDSDGTNAINYAKSTRNSFSGRTIVVDSSDNIHSLLRKPFCSDYSISVYTPEGDELRTYGTGLLYYGNCFCISRLDYSVAGEGDCVRVFSPSGELFKSIKGFGLVSDVQITNTDVLFVADSWNKNIYFLQLAYPPLSLYENCVRNTVLHLNELPVKLLPLGMQRLFNDWNFLVRVEIWTTKELEIAYSEVFVGSDAPMRRSRTESRAVVSNSKSFRLKLKLGIEFDAVRKIIAAKLNKPAAKVELYCREQSLPNKLPEYGILKRNHNKIAAMFV